MSCFINSTSSHFLLGHLQHNYFSLQLKMLNSIREACAQAISASSKTLRALLALILVFGLICELYGLFTPVNSPPQKTHIHRNLWHGTVATRGTWLDSFQALSKVPLSPTEPWFKALCQPYFRLAKIVRDYVSCSTLVSHNSGRC